VHCFPNNKPWVTKDIKASLNRKKAAFRSGDKEDFCPPLNTAVPGGAPPHRGGWGWGWGRMWR